MLLSSIVPVYREEENIPEHLRLIRPIPEGISTNDEIIFALKSSPDLTE